MHKVLKKKLKQALKTQLFLVHFEGPAGHVIKRGSNS